MTTEILPKVSILLPTYKDAVMIRGAVESVISQTYPSWELIIIDDGLTSTAIQVMQEYVKKDSRIILLPYESNVGIQKSLNKGLRAARGMYIGRIDDDDKWIDLDKLAKQVRYLDQNQDCVLLGTNAVTCTEEGKILSTYALPNSDQSIRARLLFKNSFLHPTVMMRKDSVVQAGGYDERDVVKHIEDYALWLTLGKLGSFSNLQDVTAQLTIHANSLTFQNRIAQAKRVRTLIRLYRNQYPHFFMANLVLLIRIIGFTILRHVPIPQKMLFWIQKTYKEI